MKITYRVAMYLLLAIVILQSILFIVVVTEYEKDKQVKMEATVTLLGIALNHSQSIMDYCNISLEESQDIFFDWMVEDLKEEIKSER